MFISCVTVRSSMLPLKASFFQSKSWFPSRETSKSVVPFTVQNENESEGDTDVKTTNIKIVNEEVT